MTTFNLVNVACSALMLFITVIGVWVTIQSHSCRLGVELLVQADDFIVRVTNIGRRDVELSRIQIVWQSRFSLQTIVLFEFRPPDGGTVHVGRVSNLPVSIASVTQSLENSRVLDEPYVRARVITSLYRFYLSPQRVLLDL